ncbi:RsmD family RNA methyltransferase, partial [Ramlibacter sp.]|uniref:RsmD family RNA methyltransferase n=1 Tax=Ramlibacter sp. TaxID=1917967 RepID=UPI0018321D10
LVEHDAGLVAQLRATQARLQAMGVRVQRGNGLTALAALPPGGVDLVFLDPPFDAGLYDKALAAAAPSLAPEGLVYLEAPSAWDDRLLAPHGLELVRHLRAGAVHAHLLRRHNAAQQSAHPTAG